MNRCQRRLCGDIIESKDRHDFVRCKCGEIFTDGGDDYMHRGAKNIRNIIDLSGTEYCPRCGKLYSIERRNEDMPKEGELCRICGEMYCDDCINHKASDEKGFVCKDCVPDDDTYGCDRCGERRDWDDINWVTTGVGLCEKCYNANLTDKHCARCGYPLFKSDVEGYPYVCYECDENMYEFETEEAATHSS